MAELGMLKLNCAKRLLEAVEPATLKFMRGMSQTVSGWACLQSILSPADKTQHVRDG